MANIQSSDQQQASPATASSWTIHQVVDWLRVNEFGEFTEKFLGE